MCDPASDRARTLCVLVHGYVWVPARTRQRRGADDNIMTLPRWRWQLHGRDSDEHGDNDDDDHDDDDDDDEDDDDEDDDDDHDEHGDDDGGTQVLRR